MSARRELEDEIARICVLQQCASTLIQHIPINALRLEEGDFALPGRALGFEAGELIGELRNFLVEVLPGTQAVIAGIGIYPEIADQKRGNGIERKRIRDGAESAACDHGPKMAPRA